MTQQSFFSFDSSLLVRDAQGRYLPTSADQILDAARQVIDQKNPRGTLFSSLALVKDYLRTKHSLVKAILVMVIARFVFHSSPK